MNTSINKAPSVEIWMVRHGETIFNKKGLVQGWCDSPLTLNGRHMSACLGLGLREAEIEFDAIYSSDLTRCIDTAKLIRRSLGSGQSITYDRRLREINTGDGEGELIENHLKKYPFSLNFKKHPGTPNGETWADVYARVLPALEDIRQKHQSNDGKIKWILVVAHSMIIASIVGYLDPTKEEVVPIPNNSVSLFTYKGDALTLGDYGNTSYIETGIECSEKYTLNEAV